MNIKQETIDSNIGNPTEIPPHTSVDTVNDANADNLSIKQEVTEDVKDICNFSEVIIKQEVLDIKVEDCEEPKPKGAYRKQLKNEVCTSGDEYKKFKRYKYADSLQFLKPYLQDRGTLTNVKNGYGESQGTEDDTQQDDSIDWQEMIDINMHHKEEEEKRECEDGQEEKEEEPILKIVETQTFSRKRQAQQTKTSPNLLITYIREKEKIQKRKESDEGADALKHLFSRMYSTVKKFPPTLQAETKMKLFNIVTEAELQYLRGQNIAASTHTPSLSRTSTPLFPSPLPSLSFMSPSPSILFSYTSAVPTPD